MSALGGPAFVAELTADFVREGAETLDLMAEAMAAQDAGLFRDHAHGLGSAAANLGAHELHAVCSAAQHLSRTAFTVQSRVEIEAITAEFERACRALQELCNAA